MFIYLHLYIHIYYIRRFSSIWGACWPLASAASVCVHSLELSIQSCWEITASYLPRCQRHWQHTHTHTTELHTKQNTGTPLTPSSALGCMSARASLELCHISIYFHVYKCTNKYIYVYIYIYIYIHIPHTQICQF